MRLPLWFGLLSLAALALTSVIALADDAPLTSTELSAALQKPPRGKAAEQLAARIRALAGKQDLTKGMTPAVDRQGIIFALETKGKPDITVQISGATVTMPLTRLGRTPLYAGVVAASSGDEVYTTGIAAHWTYLADSIAIRSGDLEWYPTDPENLSNPNVPHGRLTEMPVWHSQIFPNTEHKWWVYVPAQYQASSPACVMVFQDGEWYKDHVPAAFDNLIAKGAMPVTVAVFVHNGGNNRSFEYDTLSDQYARFLLEEILPEVEKTTPLRHDANSRAVAGMSSGGICSFTLAWQRPDQFSKVLSWIGSFTGIQAGKTLREGGNTYPVMIRKTEKKPIRVFLQDGANDLDNEHGNWPLANQEMAKALAYKGYDYKFVFGSGKHEDRHGRALLAASLRWLWRDYKP